MESLDLSAAQLPESLPLLLDHRSDVRSTVGQSTNLRVQGDELLGDGTLTSDTSIDWLVSPHCRRHRGRLECRLYYRALT